MKSFEDEVLKDRGDGPNLRQSETAEAGNHEHGASTPPAALTPRHVLSLQRSAGNGAVAQLLADDEEQTSVRDIVGRGGGQPLPAGSLQRMETSFGQDLSDVRVHSGSEAAASARSVQARAYTVGNDIVLGEGSPSIESSEGQRTLAHELTHVIQQRSGPVDGTETAGGLSISDPSDRFEREAENVADSVTNASMASETAGGQATAGTGSVSVQREEEAEEESEE